MAPKSMQPDPELVATAKKIAKGSGAQIMVTDDLNSGLKGCDFLYTDVRVSMGEPEEVWAKRRTACTPSRR